jgi:hypothetical protein
MTKRSQLQRILVCVGVFSLVAVRSALLAQPDVREFEALTQYKSNIIYDKDQTLGYPFVMFYNGKKKSGYERIGMAVSRDMRHWWRYGAEPVIDNGKGISGDRARSQPSFVVDLCKSLL